jgi:hypothetical protein
MIAASRKKRAVTLSSSLQIALKCSYCGVDIGIMRPKGLYRTHRVNNCTMVAPAKDPADFRQGAGRHLFG